MNAPMLWILFPAASGVVLFFLRRRVLLVSLIATIICLVLAGLAWFLPGTAQINLGGFNAHLDETFFLLGRSFTLGASERPTVALIFMMAGLWFGAVPIVRAGMNFVPLALGVISLLTAAIAVDPFLYAALLIEVSVLLSIPMLIEPGSSVGPGILRYLTFQTLGMPFILLTGWMLEGISATPADPEFVVQLTLLMGLGFAFLLAVFPFYTWIPMLAEEAHPYVASFIFVVLPGAIFVLLLGFINQFPWLREVRTIGEGLRWAGILVIVTSGVWSIFQRQLGRILAYALILEIGFSFLSISLALSEGSPVYLGLFFGLLVPRSLALGVWSLSLSILRQEVPDLNVNALAGIGRRLPLTAGSVILANLTLAGVPLLASFPLRTSLLNGLSGVHPQSAWWALVGCLGLLIAGMRTLSVLVATGSHPGWQLGESWSQRIFLAIGCVVLLLMGLFPQWFIPLLADLPAAFQQLALR